MPEVAVDEAGRPGTAVVTGASAGIGAAYAERLAAAGHDLVLVARRGDRLRALGDRLAGSYGIAAEPLTADLTDAGSRAAVEDRLRADDVTLLVNNAGIAGYAPLAEADPDVLDKVMALNVVAPTHLTRAALPGMVERGRGAVVMVASLLAFSGELPPGRLPYRATYASTKAYLVALARTLAAEVEGTGVRVQVCCPGYTATEFHVVTGAEPVSEELASRPRDEPYAMSAGDVVTASLHALGTGEVVCVPGLDDPAAVGELAAAEGRLLAGGRRVLARRYGGPGDTA